MAETDRDQELRNDFAPLVEELGFKIVELHSATVHGRVHLDVVIHSPDGVSIDNCAAVHRLLRPRAELMLDDRDVAVQIASPGIDRVLKENSEFCIFIGSKVRVLLHGADNWVAGLISSSDDTSVALETDSGMQTIMFAEIQKAKLE